jgi:hypothetical protein
MVTFFALADSDSSDTSDCRIFCTTSRSAALVSVARSPHPRSPASTAALANALKAVP